MGLYDIGLHENQSFDYMINKSILFKLQSTENLIEYAVSFNLGLTHVKYSHIIIVSTKFLPA